jgi:hypothetical protein
MATTAQDIQNSEDLLSLSNQILNSYDERAKVLGKLSKEERSYKVIVSQQQKLSQQIVANSDKYLGYQIKSKDLAKQIKDVDDNRRESLVAFGLISSKISTDEINALAEKNKLISDQGNLQARIGVLDTKNDALKIKVGLSRNKSIIADLQDQIRINDREAAQKEKEIKLLDKQIDKQHDIAKSAAQILKDQQESEIAQQKELDFLRENLRIRKQVEKSTGLLGALSKAVSKIPGIGKYLNADKAIEDMETLAASIAASGGDATSFGNRLQIAGKGLSTLAKGFYENIKSPEAIIRFFVNAAMTANKESVNLSKNLGYGAANADRVRVNFVDIEGSANNLNVTTANLSEAFNELSTSTGFVSEYSADALTTQIKLTKQLGLTGDEAAGVYKFSVLTGKSSEQTYQSMLKGYVATRNSLNVGIPFKAAIAEASKVSGQLASNLGNNPENIIKAVVATKALGTSLEQVKTQGESLLNFDSSIDNELKAELITGKQLNLERARAAALMGDQVTVAEELASQGMTAAKFSGMNVIAQKSYAEALGTTSDELANQLAKREMALASGKSLAQITAEEADSAVERQDVQSKFNVAMEKLQSIVGNLVAGPLGTMLEMLSRALEIINHMGPVLIGLATTFAIIKLSSMAIAAYQGFSRAAIGAQILRLPALISLQGALTAIQTQGAIAAISGASALTLGIGAIAIIAGIAAAVGAMKLYTADDMTSPGYGKRTILSPEGAIKLNDNDTVIAGTNLGGGKTESVKSTSNIDLTPMISAINQVTNAVNALNAKKWDVYLDSKLVGSGLMQNSYRAA